MPELPWRPSPSSPPQDPEFGREVREWVEPVNDVWRLWRLLNSAALLSGPRSADSLVDDADAVAARPELKAAIAAAIEAFVPESLQCAKALCFRLNTDDCCS
mmetsp:Transcript_2823/g.7774  ORF Transcript_2823/g.7774 Transcript_2823/m.7774 type:complete len:102 (+) Transcript_2823:250-555(+)